MSLKDLDFSDGFESSVAPTQGLLSASSLQVFANDTAFETSKGSAAADGDSYINSTTGLVRFYISGWQNVVDEDNVQTLVNKAMSDATSSIVDDGDATKALNFSLGGATTSTTTTLTFAQTANRAITFPDADDTLVGLAATQTLSNKTLDDATTRIADDGDNTKLLAFELSGITTATTRTLTVPDASTTILGTDSAQVVTNKDIDGGTASSTSRLTLPKDTKANIDGLTRKQGTLLYSSDEDKVYKDDGSTLTEIGSGSGSGGVNYIDNGEFETDTTGWAAYADAAGSQPVDGTGGSPTVTITAQSSNILAGTQSGRITKDAADRQGEGVSYDLTIDAADKTSPLRIEFNYEGSANFDVDDVVMDIYDVDAGALVSPRIQPHSLDGSGRFIGEFQPTDSTSRDYRLIFHIATTNASAWTLDIDRVKLGPMPKVSGVPASDWESYTPTVAGLGTGSGTATGKYRIIGDSVEIAVRFTKDGSAGTGAAAVTFTLPNSLSADESKIPDGASGAALGFSSITGTNFVLHGPVSIATDLLYSRKADSASNVTGADLAAGSNYTFRALVPITGFSANVALSEDADTRVVAAKASGDAASASDGNPIIWPTVNFDTHGAYNNVGGGYDVPVSGLYEVECKIISSDNNVQVYVYKDTVLDTYMGTTSTVGEGTFTALVEADAGNVLDVRPNGASLDVASGVSNVSFKRLSGPATIAASEKVVASYTNLTNSGAVNTGAGDVVTWQSKEVDTHNALSAGVFTVPRSGYYSIEAQVNTTISSATGAITVRIQKNGTTVREKTQHAAPTAGRVVSGLAVALLKLEARDLIRVVARDGFGTSTYTSSSLDNFFHISSV